MAGTFTKGNLPALADAYFDWEAEAAVVLEPSIGGIVAITQTAKWGPIRTAILLESFDEYTQTFGNSDCPLRRAVHGAFKGEGRPGKGGAGAVLVFRMGTNAAAAATKTFQNTTPATALTLTALYKGTRGNDFRFTIQAGVVGGTQDFIIFDGALLVEKYTYTSTDVASLAAMINTSSAWFSAVANITGVALATASAVAATGGLDGDTLTSAEWLAAQDAFDTERFSVVGAVGLTDSTIRAAFIAWVQQRNTLGKRCTGVVGGAAAESMSTANTRSQGINSYDIVNIGGPTMHLDDLGVDASSSEMVARACGSIAARGEKRDLIYARFADVSVPEGVTLPTLTEQEAALAAGTTCFTQDTNTDAPIFIREGVTTYTDDSQSPVDNDGVKTHPVKLYKRIKNLRIQQGIELEVQDWATSSDILGELAVNDRTRAIVGGFLTTIYQRREDAEIIQPGWTIQVDNDPPPDDDQDFIAYRHGFHPTRSLRMLLNTARIG